MNISVGNFYFVSNDFFKLVNDPYLKVNYEIEKRPHYFALQDEQTRLYWLVPVSSKVEKFEKIIADRHARHKPTDGIKIVTVQNQKSALLLQDMFPVSNKYIEAQYIRGGQPVCIANPNTIDDIVRSAKKVIHLLHKGIKITPTQPDINRIERLMLADLEKEPPVQATPVPTVASRLEAAKAKCAEQAQPTPGKGHQQSR